jgi:hypothetical protein
VRDEFRGEDHPMMVGAYPVEELERVSVMTDHLDEASAEELPIAPREISLIVAERLPLIDW